jgi:Zn-dependent protease
MNIVDIIMQITVLVFAVIIHEVSHGYVAYMLGDPTAKDAGRLTLNPVPHIDPFMSVLLPAFLIFSGSPFVIGGAKPVPINPAYFKHHKKDVMLVSFAGPGSNLILAILGVGLFVLAAKVPFLRNPGVFRLLQYLILINVVLAIFNLIPVPPLDGSNILMSLLPDEAAYNYAKLAPFGFLIIVVMLIFNVFNAILTPVLMAIQNLLNFLI